MRDERPTLDYGRPTPKPFIGRYETIIGVLFIFFVVIVILAILAIGMWNGAHWLP